MPAISSRIKVVALAAVILTAAAVAYWLLSRPTPESAARTYAHRMIAGDIEWIYEHATDEEKQTAGFSQELVSSFYSEFLRTALDGAEISSELALTPFSGTMCTANFEVTLKNGEVVPVSVFAFVEEGQMRIGACESLLYMAALIHYRSLPVLMDRIRKGWRVYSPWFVEHGMPVMYSSQDGGVIKLDAE